ncbi:FecR family protein [Dyella sp.]|uniref:FecR family protein n=1 Tax=Dyella sp. TaxID=1869338 RepID=UPI002ED07872
MTAIDPATALGREAADWWARLREDEPPQAMIDAWLAWMEADARHAQAFEQVSALAQALQLADASTQNQWRMEFAPPRRMATRWLGAAALAASLVLAVLGWYVAGRPGTDTTRSYASEVGQNQDIRLPDGSVVALGAGSRLSTDYASGHRRIDLAEGEAFFTVQHDASKPFVVAAGDVRIEDLGTAFNVRRTGREVTVAVTQGSVRLDRPGGKDGAALVLVAGQQARYQPGGGAFTVASVSAAHAAAWRDDRLEFVDEPLSTVIANVNRYSHRPVQIADSRLGALTFTGTVNIHTIDSWVSALPRVFPVQVSRFADHVVLSSAAR